MTFPPFEMMAAALKSEGNIWAGYRKDRTDWSPQDLKAAHPPGGKAKNVYFAGCTASYVEHDIGQASVRLLDKAGVDFAHLGKKENCCGTPMLVAGKWDLFAEIMKQNIELVKEAGADTVITSCPACDMMWRQSYPEWAKKLGIDYPIKARHYSEILAEQIKAGKFRFPKPEKPVTVTWHDSCHIGRASGVYEPPRDLIKAIPNVKLVEMSHNREQAHCCGSVLTLIKEPPVAADIGKVKLDEALAAGAEKILSLCPCCQFQLRVTADKKDVPIEVQDLAHFAAATFGYDLPRSEPGGQKAVGGLRGHDHADDPAGVRRPDGHDVAGADRRHAARHGAHDAPHGQGPRRAEPDEADVPGALPAPAAADDAQGDADHAQEGRGADPDARLHARADAGSHAQGHGQPHAAHDRRRGAADHPADDRLPAGEVVSSCSSGEGEDCRT